MRTFVASISLATKILGFTRKYLSDIKYYTTSNVFIFLRKIVPSYRDPALCIL